jgi:hypothetical protein
MIKWTIFVQFWWIIIFQPTKLCLVVLIQESCLFVFFFDVCCAEALNATYMSSCTWTWRRWVTVQSSARQAPSGLIQTFDCNKHNTIFHAFMYISMHGHVLVDSNKTLWVATWIKSSTLLLLCFLFAITLASVN